MFPLVRGCGIFVSTSNEFRVKFYIKLRNCSDFKLNFKLLSIGNFVVDALKCSGDHFYLEKYIIHILRDSLLFGKQPRWQLIPETVISVNTEIFAEIVCQTLNSEKISLTHLGNNHETN